MLGLLSIATYAYETVHCSQVISWSSAVTE